MEEATESNIKVQTKVPRRGDRQGGRKEGQRTPSGRLSQHGLRISEECRFSPSTLDLKVVLQPFSFYTSFQIGHKLKVTFYTKASFPPHKGGKSFCLTKDMEHPLTICPSTIVLFKMPPLNKKKIKNGSVISSLVELKIVCFRIAQCMIVLIHSSLAKPNSRGLFLSLYGLIVCEQQCRLHRCISPSHQIYQHEQTF